MREGQREPPYTVKEYAKEWRVSANTIYTMVRRGEVPAVRFGGAIRIPREAGDQRLQPAKPLGTT